MSKTKPNPYECRICGKRLPHNHGICLDCKRDEREAMMEMEWDARRDEERLNKENRNDQV